jgi:hypothetical protein
MRPQEKISFPVDYPERYRTVALQGMLDRSTYLAPFSAVSPASTDFGTFATT